MPAAAPNFRAAVLPQPHDAITPSRRCRCPGPPPPLPFTSQRGGGGSEGAPQAVHSAPPPAPVVWGGEECGDGGRLQAGGIRASSGPVLHPLTATPTSLPHAARHIRARRVLCAGGQWASVWGGRAREASERARSTAVAGWFTCHWGSHLRRLLKSRRLPRPCARYGRWTIGRLASIVVLIRLFLLSFAFLPIHLVRLFSPLPLVSPSLCPRTSLPPPSVSLLFFPTFHCLRPFGIRLLARTVPVLRFAVWWLCLRQPRHLYRGRRACLGRSSPAPLLAVTTPPPLSPIDLDCLPSHWRVHGASSRSAGRRGHCAAAGALGLGYVDATANGRLQPTNRYPVFFAVRGRLSHPPACLTTRVPHRVSVSHGAFVRGNRPSGRCPLRRGKNARDGVSVGGRRPAALWSADASAAGPSTSGAVSTQGR